MGLNDDTCLTQVTQCSSQHAKPWAINCGNHSFRESIQGARGRAMRAASIPERNLKPWSQVRELLRSSHWHSQVPERKPTSSKSMSMMVLIPKIDVGEGLDPQNRCRQAFEFPKSMSERAWAVKINVGDGLNFQNRCR